MPVPDVVRWRFCYVQGANLPCPHIIDHRTENQNIATQDEDLIPQLFLTQGSAFTVKKVSEMTTKDDNIMFHWSV